MERRFFLLTGSLVVVITALSLALALVVRNQSDTLLHKVTNGEGDVITSFQTLSEFSEDEPKVTSQVVGNNQICLSKGCISTAAEVLQMMNSKVNPCDDFYSFACGNFIDETVIPDDRTRVSMFSVLGDKLEEQVRGLLEGAIMPEEPKPFRMAKAVFQSCMDTERIERLGLDPLKRILSSLGGWPVLEGAAWVDPEFKWYNTIYKFRDIGYSVDYLVDFSVTTDLKNSSFRVLDLDQPGLGMAREYLMKGIGEPDVQAYFEYMMDVAMLLGAEPEAAKEEMMEVLRFEMAIANISLPREERRDASRLYNPMRIDQLQTLDPTTPWLDYINRLLNGVVNVTGSEVIIVDVPSYIRDFSSLLAVTPVRVQANYLMWRAAASSMTYMTEAADKIALKFSKKLTGNTEEPPRWRKCVSAASGSLANAVGSLYVKRYFNEDAKADALEMVAEIRAQF